MNVAMAIGPFIGIFISGHGSFHIVFLIGSTITLTDLIVALFLKVQDVKISVKNMKNSARFNWRDYVEPEALPISVAVFAITLAYTSLVAFLSLYAKEINLVNVSSFFFIVYTIALLASRPFAGRWFDNFGENRLTYPLIICLAIGFLFLSQVHSGILFLVSGALIGIGYGTIISNFQAIAIQQSPRNRKALAASSFFILLDLANAVGPYFMGILIEFMSFRYLYLNVAIWNDRLYSNLLCDTR